MTGCYSGACGSKSHLAHTTITRAETWRAILLPFLAFFAIGRPGAGLAALGLQLSVVGWIPAAVWAYRAYKDHMILHRMLTMAVT